MVTVGIDRNKRLSRRWLALIGAGVAILAASGCQPDATKQLLKENPIPHQPVPPDRIFITCHYIPFELPGQVDVTAMAFWKGTAAEPGAGATAAVAPRVAPSTINPDMQQLWRENGLEVAVFPQDQWLRIQQELTEAGGRMLSDFAALYQTPTQMAEYPALPLTAPCSLFVFDRQGKPRGYELAAGQGTWRMNCQIWPGDSSQRSAQFKIVPVLVNGAPREKYVRTDTGYTRQQEVLEVVFDGATLEGVLPPGTFLLVIARPTRDRGLNLGQLLLARTGVESRQWVVVIAPHLQTAKEIKDAVRKE
jgi:hypothetical protein